MRRTAPASFALAAIVLATAGCDSEQPASESSTTATLSIRATALIDNNWCWDMWFDEDGNGVPEFDLQQKYCEVVSTQQVKDNHPVPWRYTAQVSILRAGQTVPEIIASSVVPNDSVQDYVSLTDYDPLVLQGPPKANDGQIYYLNGIEVSRGSQIWLQANGYDIGTPNVLEHTPSLEFQLSLGDTVIVEARKQAIVDSPGFLQDPSDTSDPDLVLTGILRVGSGEVLVNGTTFSSSADKAGFSFSYTRR